MLTSVLVLTACGPVVPGKNDVTACRRLRQTITQMADQGTAGSAGAREEAGLGRARAAARDARLREAISVVENSLVVRGADYSNFAYGNESAALMAISRVCAGIGVTGVAG